MLVDSRRRRFECPDFPMLVYAIIRLTAGLAMILGHNVRSEVHGGGKSVWSDGGYDSHSCRDERWD